jgi:IS30 family transposase
LTKFPSNRNQADHVKAKLAAFYSPTTIAIELARAAEIGGDTMSPESIYQAVYEHGFRGLVAGLSNCLHRKWIGHKKRCRAGVVPKKACPLDLFNLIGPRSEIACSPYKVGRLK